MNVGKSLVSFNMPDVEISGVQPNLHFILKGRRIRERERFLKFASNVGLKCLMNTNNTKK